MVSLFSIVLTFLALVLIPAGLFISRRLSVPLSFRNILRFIELTASKNINDEKERNDKRGTMRKKRLPKHVAIILDGNRRWAEKRGLRTYEGHKAGARKLMESAKDFFDMTTSTCHKDRARKLMENTKDCFDMGTKTLSLFAFSTENWARPEDEVNGLMSLFEEYFRSEIHVLKREKIKISVIGNRTRIPQSLLDLVREAEEDTKGYVGKHLILAIDYSGKFDILQACKSLAEKAKSGLIQIEDIDESIMDEELMTKCSEFPNPDLLIRTSGEQRISNFFLWQSAYTELYFTNVLWPDFGEAEFLDALTWYQERDRRFGRRV